MVNDDYHEPNSPCPAAFEYATDSYSGVEPTSTYRRRRESEGMRSSRELIEYIFEYTSTPEKMCIIA